MMDEMGWDSQVDSSRCYFREHAQARNRLALRRAIARVLSTEQIPAIAEETAEYNKWSVLDEESLDEVPQYCKPILLYAYQRPGHQ
jgi:hypothetical protein